MGETDVQLFICVDATGKLAAVTVALVARDCGMVVNCSVLLLVVVTVVVPVSPVNGLDIVGVGVAVLKVDAEDVVTESALVVEPFDSSPDEVAPLEVVSPTLVVLVVNVVDVWLDIPTVLSI